MNNRDRLLEIGLELFSSRPYSGTGVREITQAVGVPTGSFHYYFKNKEDFALSVLTYFFQKTFTKKFEEIINSDNLSGKEKIIRIFRTLVRHYLRTPGQEPVYGCIMGNLGQEISAHTPAIAAKLREHIEGLLKALTRLAEQGKDDGSIMNTCKSRQMVGFVFDAYEGAMMRRKIYNSDQPLNDFLQSLPAML
ncbi:TetR/AcrR family transcriptional regulator [Chitinophaga pendula]|uniref:TetR/AcrR family transcriptional regulator n=1 Tax=Chitinophaga TaxID=79328 RepID=UPI000BAFFBF6|nr:MULTISPECIES: TetR/AcrR family transcriptional regulator [Chitinophaga]ASZ14064.1 hypothetical protein CK934_25495 [Chitinophaga sp. MD30]UCJ08305.1 TetR/AcrR family transcriptional regulator [Chitinophaga pendula]